MKGHALLWAAAGAVILTGCSSKPRNFAPVMAAPPADGQAYEAQWLACREQVAGMSRKGSERGASAAGGAAAGAGVAAAGAGIASTTTGMAAGFAVAGATLIAAPVALIGGAWGISKIKKTKKEKAIKAATAECMAKSGYTVDKWRVMSKQEVRELPTGAVAGAAAPVAEPK